MYFLERITDITIIHLCRHLFSTAYALSGFVAAYSWDVMWMDVVAVAPLAIVGLEKLR